MTTWPDVQYVLRPGITELRWGNPAPELLPVGGLARASARALEVAGAAALNYGAEQGPGRLLLALGGWLGQHCGEPRPIETIFITGGVSYALDLLCTLFAHPGDCVLVASPTYHLALRIFRDHGLELLPVPGDEESLHEDGLTAMLHQARKQGRRPAFLYLVPTFGNPSGDTIGPARRAALVDLAQREGLLVLEDDVYRELWYEAPPPPALYDLAPVGTVIRLGSFSKILAPGLRLGWLEATPEVVRRCVGSGLVDSGGGASHLVAHVVAECISMGLLDEHIAGLRVAYRRRRDILCAALERHLRAGCSFARPGGGFFVWVRLPEGIDSTVLLPVAEARGVSFVPGGRFFSDAGGEGGRYLRLAFTLLADGELEEGARRLGTAIREAYRA